MLEILLIIVVISLVVILFRHKKKNKEQPFTPIIKRDNTETGVFYNSIAEASFYVGISLSTLGDQLRGRYKNKTNLILA